MEKLFKIGRIFFGAAVTEIGLQSIFYREFPYILQLPPHFSATAGAVMAVIWGVVFTIAGLSILLEKKAGQISFLFGCLLLAIFCFYYIPYQFLVSKNYMHLPDWENAEKELAFAGGALVIAGCYQQKPSGKLTQIGAFIFAVTIVSFGMLHFMLAKESAPYVPQWIPWHLFWILFCGAALLGSGIAIIFNIQTRLTAGLLGLMIFLWFVMLHIPRVIVSPLTDIGGEISSAFFALAYSGVAFAIAGAAKSSPGS